MKKTIAITLSIITIIISVWLATKSFKLLDIPSNKNDQYAAFQKNEIDTRTDINVCEKEILKLQIDSDRKKDREISNIAFSTQFIAFIIIFVQLVLIVVIFIMPKRERN